jgi:hypothetical protein
VRDGNQQKQVIFKSIINFSHCFEVPQGLWVVIQGQMGHSEHVIQLEVFRIVVESSLDALDSVGHLVARVELPASLQESSEVTVFD